MKKIFILSFLFIVAATSFAQSISHQSIEHSVFVWHKLHHLKGAKENHKMDNRFYSIVQLSVCDSFVNLIQVSYVPKGALGMMLKKMLIFQH